MHAHPTERGLTLIEIMVVLALMASMLALSFSTFGSLKNAGLRAEAMRLSGALRMVYGRAAVNGLRYQVTFDIDDNSYSVQCSPENVLLPPAETPRTRRDSDDEESDPFGLGSRAPTLDDCSEPLLESTPLRRSVEIDRVLTVNLSEAVDVGSVTVAYFPNGFVERTLIWLKSGDTFVTLSVDPMTGRVFIHGEDLDVPRDFFSVDEDR